MVETIYIIQRQNINSKEIKEVKRYKNKSIADRYIFRLNQEVKLNELPYKYYKEEICKLIL